MDAAENVPLETTSLREDALRAIRHLASGMWAGLICGFLIGGIGGRLAMFVLRLTSDPALHGRLTDDEFTIGSFTSSTIFLVLLTTAAGMLGGLFYLAVRGWLPERIRPWAMALFGGAVGGAVVIKPDGIDFTALDPLALAVAMFFLLPALYGFALSHLAERFLARRKESPGGSPLPTLLLLLGFVFGGPIGGLLLVLIALGWWLNRAGVPIESLWHSAPMTLLGRLAFAGLIAMGLYGVTKDAFQIL